MEKLPTEIDENDPDVVRLTEMQWDGKISDLTSVRKHRTPPVSRKVVFHTWSKLPVQKLPQSESNIWDAVVISCTRPSEFQLHLKTGSRNFDRMQSNINRFCIGNFCEI